MKCPECLDQAMSFSKFLLTLYPRKINCYHCGAELHLAVAWVRGYWYSLLVTFILAVIAATLRSAVGWSIIASVIGFLVLAIAFMYYFWQNAAYYSEKRPAT